MRIQDDRLTEIAAKVHDGKRLSREDGLVLATTHDLLTVGQLANTVRERLHQDAAYYNINRHLNPTNVCAATCKLCAFSVPYENRDKGWTYSVEKAVEVAGRDVDRSVTELHIVGGLHPELKIDYYEQLFEALKKRFPWIHLKALTMVELDFLSSNSRLPLDDVIDRLVEAGLDSCPGGGAEIFAEEIRSEICGHKMSGERWLEVARTVHRAGLRSNCTMLYGHIEEAEHRVDHLIKLRELQDETNGFQCFIPLSFHPQNTAFSNLPPTGGRLDLQTIALSRLLLDNIPHIKAYWIMLGEKVAQVALQFGADDLDGTVVDERITLAAGGEAGSGISRGRLEGLIREAGRRPILRDTLYRPLDGVSDRAEQLEQTRDQVGLGAKICQSG